MAQREPAIVPAPVSDVTVSTATNLVVLANDSDPDGDALAYTTATDPQHGRAAIAGNAQSLMYTPASQHTGRDSFVYTVSDG